MNNMELRTSVSRQNQRTLDPKGAPVGRDSKQLPSGARTLEEQRPAGTRFRIPTPGARRGLRRIQAWATASVPITAMRPIPRKIASTKSQLSALLALKGWRQMPSPGVTATSLGAIRTTHCLLKMI